jgi:curved DNA-binding protein CbpA
MYRSADRLHYKTLKVEPGATLGEIRRAYHRTSLKAHPDHGGTHSDMLAVSMLIFPSVQHHHANHEPYLRSMQHGQL